MPSSVLGSCGFRMPGHVRAFSSTASSLTRTEPAEPLRTPHRRTTAPRPEYRVKTCMRSRPPSPGVVTPTDCPFPSASSTAVFFHVRSAEPLEVMLLTRPAAFRMHTSPLALSDTSNTPLPREYSILVAAFSSLSVRPSSVRATATSAGTVPQLAAIVPPVKRAFRTFVDILMVIITRSLAYLAGSVKVFFFSDVGAIHPVPTWHSWLTPFACV